MIDFKLSGLPVGISYSMGKSSEWMVYAIIHGLLPRPEHVAIFQADTGDEYEWSYEAAIRVREAAKFAGIPYFECRDKETLSGHMVNALLTQATRADQPPLWIDKGLGSSGRVANRCTLRFKVAPMRRAQSEWLRSINMPKKIEKWIGFGHDERNRAVKSLSKRDVQWEMLRFPAIEIGRSREQTYADLEKWRAPMPGFSMCIHCPHHNIKRWLETPHAEYKRASAFDEAIRDLDTIGLTDGPAYVSDSLVPLSNRGKLIQLGTSQQSLPGMDAGCDGGHCFL